MPMLTNDEKIKKKDYRNEKRASDRELAMLIPMNLNWNEWMNWMWSTLEIELIEVFTQKSVDKLWTQPTT